MKLKHKTLYSQSTQAYIATTVFAVLTAMIITIGLSSNASAAVLLGKQVYQEQVGGVTQIMSSDIDGSNPVNISNTSTSSNNPRISPDGQQVVWDASDAGEGYDVYIANIDGTNKRVLAGGVDNQSAPSFSSDGQYIVYVNTVGPFGEIWVMDASDGGNKRHVTGSGGGSIGGPVFADGDTKIFYTSYRNRNGGANNDIYYIKADGTGSEVVLTNTGNSTSEVIEDVSPDGSTVLYRLVGVAPHAILTMSATSPFGATSLYSNNNIYGARFNHDGSEVLFPDTTDGNIKSINAADGSNITNLGPGTAIKEQPFVLVEATSGTIGVDGMRNIIINEDLSANNYDFASTNITIESSGIVNNVVVHNGSLLKGVGEVRGSLTQLAGGMVEPGASPGCLTVGSGLSLLGSTTMELGGTTVCTEYDQIDVTGTVTIDTSATLSVTHFGGYTPGTAAPSVYTIINNDSNDAVVGTFSGLAEGSTISVAGYDYVISYVGGDGNDVTLTHTPPPVTTTPATPAPTTSSSDDDSDTATAPNTGLKLQREFFAPLFGGLGLVLIVTGLVATRQRN